LARAPGGQMRGAATKAMSDIVEERDADARPPPRPCGLRPAGPLALLPLLDDVRHRLRRGASHLPARRSRQNVNLFLREPLAASFIMEFP